MLRCLSPRPSPFRRRMNSAAAAAETTTTQAPNRKVAASRGDRIFRALIMAIVWIVLAIFAGVLVVLVSGAWPAMKRFGPGFIVRTGWDPVHLVFGALPFMVGTIIVAVGAMVLAGGVGLVDRHLHHRIAAALVAGADRLSDRVAGVHSERCLRPVRPAGAGAIAANTVEIWLLEHLGPRFAFFNGAPYGVGYLSAIVILAIMLLPLIVSLSREALILVPHESERRRVCLGATRWEWFGTSRFPFARNGIVGAFVLSLGRALGETMAVAMTIGGGFRLPTTIMDQGYTLASVIANEFNEVSSEIYLSALIYCGLILFVLTVGVNILAYFIVRRLAGIRGFSA